MSKAIHTYGAWLTAVILALFLLSSSSVHASSDVMLSYELTHDMLPTPDNFSVTLYEDGVALVHYPQYMKAAGDYSVVLSPSEVQQLRLVLEHPLVQGFDASSVKAQKKQIDAQSQELFEISDDSWSSFEVQAAGTSKNIRWANVAVEARRYPEIGIFRKLADIEAKLLDLDQHPTATPVVD